MFEIVLKINKTCCLFHVKFGKFKFRFVWLFSSPVNVECTRHMITQLIIHKINRALNTLCIFVCATYLSAAFDAVLSIQLE